MDEKDRLLLTCLQSGLPLASRPFDVWASRVGVDSADLFVRIQRLKREGAFGGVRAIFDPRALHYQSAWVAMKCSSEKAGPVWRHPGVIYGCEREHEFNIWFFIATPETHDLELHVRCLEKLAAPARALFLPVRKIFKGSDLLSSLGTGTFGDMAESFEKRRSTEENNITEEEIQMIRRLQEPFPFTDDPFRRIASDLGITETQTLDRLRALSARGCLRRIGGFLKPSTAGSVPRSLVVWRVPEEKLERIGPEIERSEAVLYADHRPSFPDLPFSLYTMMRTESAEALENTVRKLEERIGQWPHQALKTIREFKKETMKHFPKELEEWWRENRCIAEAAFH
jgi:DNA-binding Lrp family transcriptional regulator